MGSSKALRALSAPTILTLDFCRVLTFFFKSDMETVFRDYENGDYEQCEALVNEAWEFNKNFSPQGLTDIAKLIYTKGSVLGSNYRRVIEIDGDVAGFIFGLNELFDKPKRNFLFGLSVLWKLIRIKPNEPGDKKKL